MERSKECFSIKVHKHQNAKPPFLSIPAPNLSSSALALSPPFVVASLQAQDAASRETYRQHSFRGGNWLWRQSYRDWKTTTTSPSLDKSISPTFVWVLTNHAAYTAAYMFDGCQAREVWMYSLDPLGHGACAAGTEQCCVRCARWERERYRERGREREIQRKRERERRKWRHHCRAKIGNEFTLCLAKNISQLAMSLHLPLPKIRTFRFSIHTSRRYNFLNGHNCGAD